MTGRFFKNRRRRVVFPMEYQKEEVSFVLREDETLTRSRNSLCYFGSLPFDCQSNGQRQLCGDGF